VFVISSIGKKLLEKLQRKAYRHAYLAQHVRRGIAYQIRAMRDQRKWKQGTFAQALGKPQSVVSRLEDPDYGKVTLQTLLEVANVFDVALEVRFVSYSTFICNTRDVSIPSMCVPEFKSDLGLLGLSPISVRGGQQLIVAEAGASNEIKASAGLLTFASTQQAGSLTLH
jgi:transcriptional regulator with XRE-family HTH domain